jgi:hypothetical protein
MLVTDHHISNDEISMFRESDGDRKDTFMSGSFLSSSLIMVVFSCIST